MLRILICLILAALAAALPASAAPRPFELRDGQVVIIVTIKGKQLPALLDTGATKSLIEVGLAKELGIRTQKINGGTYGASGGKVAFGFTGDVQLDFGAGNVRRRLGTYKASHSFAADGVRLLIGMDLLADMAVSLDFAKMTIDVQRPADFRAPEGKPLILKQSGWARPTLSIEIGGVWGDLLIDTAASGSLHLDSGFVAASPALKALPVSSRRIVGIDGVRERDAITAPSVRLGERVFENVRASVGSFGHLGVTGDMDGVIGVDLLKQFHLVMDFGGRRVWMTSRTSHHAD